MEVIRARTGGRNYIDFHVKVNLTRKLSIVYNKKSLTVFNCKSIDTIDMFLIYFHKFD